MLEKFSGRSVPLETSPHRWAQGHFSAVVQNGRTSDPLEVVPSGTTGVKSP